MQAGAAACSQATANGAALVAGLERHFIVVRLLVGKLLSYGLLFKVVLHEQTKAV